MKHSKCSKGLTLLALILSGLMLFSSCGKAQFKSIDISKALNENATLSDTFEIPKDGKEVSELKNANLVEYDGNLALFTKEVKDKPDETELLVYNLKTNSIVWKETETADDEIGVELNEVYYYKDVYSCFTVTIESDGKEESDASSVTTTFYSESGDEIASSEQMTYVDSVLDLLFFNEKCYRIDASGAISYAFDYSALARVPDVEEKFENQYYEFTENGVAVYDDKLTFVSKYTIDKVEARIGGCTVLENGNVFIQYTVEVDPYSEDYDYIRVEDGESVKYDLVSEIFNPKKNSAKEIECNYAIEYSENLLSNNGESASYYGINTEKYAVVGYGYKLVDKRITNEVPLTIDEKGKVTDFGELNGSPIEYIYLFDTNRWVVGTMDGEYMIDSDGKILGDITEATYIGKNMLYANGKIYNSDLTTVKDLAAEGWSINDSGYYAIFLKGLDGEFAALSSDGKIVTLIDKDSSDYVVASLKGLVMIKGASEYKIYNAEGTKILSINSDNVTSVNSVAATESGEGRLIKVQKQLTGTEGITQETLYYWIG